MMDRIQGPLSTLLERLSCELIFLMDFAELHKGGWQMSPQACGCMLVFGALLLILRIRALRPPRVIP
jgi:hypothetical protein